MAWLFGGKARAKQQALTLQLKSYPPYRAPFPGPAKALSIQQAEENLSYLLEHRQQRMEILAGILAIRGIDLPAEMRVIDPAPLLEKLYLWARAEWPGIYQPDLAKYDRWSVSTKDGKEIVLSLLMDVAIVLGQLVVTRRPQYAWLLDLDRIPGADQMTTFKRPVVKIPKGGAFPSAIICDFEDIVISEYRKVKAPALGQANGMTREVLEAISGQPEEYWLALHQGRESS